MTSAGGCSWCGKAAPSGVCMGPHPDFDLAAVVAAHDVELRDRVETHEGNHESGPVVEARRRASTKSWRARNPRYR